VAALRLLLSVIAALFGIVLAVPIVVLALPFWAVACFTRTMAHYLEPSYVAWDQLLEFTPVIGWKPKAHLDVHYLTFVEDGVFHTVTDAQGWPGTASIAESDIVVFGDSYAFGYGVNVETSFFSECHRQARIKAIGAPAYNMVQEVLLLHQLSSHLSGKLVVWFIFTGNDLNDNLVPDMHRYRMPFVREHNGTGHWEFVTSHVSPAKWPYRSARFRDYGHLPILANLHSRTFLAQRAYSACGFLIEEGRDICNHAGARLLVMTIPDPDTLRQHSLQGLFSLSAEPRSFDPALPDKKIGEICANLGVSFVSGRDHLHARHYKTLDPHWNEQGHARVASLLSSLYHDYMVPGNQANKRTKISYEGPEGRGNKPSAGASSKLDEVARHFCPGSFAC
jgi:hypothetical protein